MVIAVDSQVRSCIRVGTTEAEKDTVNRDCKVKP